MHILSIIVFLVLIALTLVITARAAKKVKTDKDFYAAGGEIPGWQNGLAIAGEFMASGAFLGIAGLIAFHGLDGEIFSICWFASFFVVLILVAEVIRNSGKYTFIDIVSYRLNQKSIRPAVAVTVFIVSLTYLIPQMVAAGALSKILFGISDTLGILIVGGAHDRVCGSGRDDGRHLGSVPESHSFAGSRLPAGLADHVPFRLFRRQSLRCGRPFP